MDRVVGIVAEYNPFHNGHKWQIEKIRSLLGDLPIIAVMSGHFTQRGQPALLDKWQRAQMAVYGGINLVLELPFGHAVKSAEFFASGGVKLLNATGVVTDICFGAECHDTALLSDIAAKTTQPDFSVLIKSGLKTGQTYAKAVETALKHCFPQAPPSIHQPNSILAIEYLKALSNISADIRPHALPRVGPGHSELRLTQEFASASAIRETFSNQGLTAVLAGCVLPPASAQIISAAFADNRLFINEEIWEKLIFYRLRQLTAQQIAALTDVSEGLEYRIKDAAQKTSSLHHLLTTAASKRYPKTRIARLITQLLVFDSRLNKEHAPPYLRVLAFDAIGRALIKKIRSKTVSPIITHPAKFSSKNDDQTIARSLNTDARSTDLFYLILGKNLAGEDLRQKPVYIAHSAI